MIRIARRLISPLHAKTFQYWCSCTLLLAAFSPSAALSQEQPIEVDNGRKFESQVLQLLPEGNYTDALLGNFRGNRCQDIIARASASGAIYINRFGAVASSVRGIPRELELKDAIAEDLNGDGLSDIISYSVQTVQWLIAFANGSGGEFSIERYTMPEVVPRRVRPNIFQQEIPGRFSVLTDGGLITLQSTANKQLSVTSREDIYVGDVRPVGVLKGVRETPETAGLSNTVIVTKNNTRSLLRGGHAKWWVWTEFPRPFGDSSSAILGDFNGDGQSDAVGFGWQLGSWWIGEAAGNTALEYPISGLSIQPDDIGKIGVGDVDCDGRDDLLARDSSTGQFRVAFSRIPPRSALLAAEPQRIGRAVEPSGPGPYVCVGYLPLTESNFSRFGRPQQCPRGYAIFSSSFEISSVIDSCCKLPLPDILSTEPPTRATTLCPKDSIATGFDYIKRELICTAINKDRYALREDEGGTHWGFGRLREKVSLAKAEVPLAFRYVLGRKSFQHWNGEGCVSYPWGGLFAGVTDENCSGHKYRRLVAVNASGDHTIATEVTMFPNCSSEVNPFDPNAGCIPATK